AWLTERSGLGRYPTGMTPTHLLGVAMTAGIGFTVAIFIANLAFADPAVVEIAKLGILVGSLVAAVGAYLTLRLTGEPGEPQEPPTGSAIG
ncbi:MAG TPA: Na+/H+ antiporter NhaA, partial [Nocardioidaceae bacterium]|nr:Na+/H+ antiporter NhaA [Nocardioidaceae bacterium]